MTKSEAFEITASMFTDGDGLPTDKCTLIEAFHKTMLGKEALDRALTKAGVHTLWFYDYRQPAFSYWLLDKDYVEV